MRIEVAQAFARLAWAAIGGADREWPRAWAKLEDAGPLYRDWHSLVDCLCQAYLDVLRPGPARHPQDHWTTMEWRDLLTALWHHGPKDVPDSGDLGAHAALQLLDEELGWRWYERDQA